jgi:hypothetical protein
MEGRRVDVQCIEAERIAIVLDLPGDYPERDHMENCPRCGALAESYRAFIDAEPVEDADLEQVRGVLDAHIRSEAQRWMPDSRTARAVWWRTRLRPAPLLAAGVVVIAAAWWFTRSPEESITRGNAPTAHVFVANTAELRADGSFELSWTAAPGADRYRIRIYGPDLHDLYHSEDVTATSMVVSKHALPAGLPRPVDLTWEVQARSGADVLAVSTPGSIHLP